MKLLTENDYKILTKVFNSKSTQGMSKISGVTVKYLSECTNLSLTKIRNALTLLIDYEFIDYGISKGRERTYYLTPKGFEEIRSLTKSTINVINKNGGNEDEEK